MDCEIKPFGPPATRSSISRADVVKKRLGLGSRLDRERPLAGPGGGAGGEPSAAARDLEVFK